MQRGHPITKKFQRWMQSVADQIGCDVINPKNWKARCDFSFGHSGAHSWAEPEAEDPFGAEPEPEQRSPIISRGTWTRVDDQWFVHARVNAKAGDFADVRSKDGTVTRVILGEKISRNVFRWEHAEQEDARS